MRREYTLAVVLCAITVIFALSALAEEKIGYEDAGAWKPMEKLDDPNAVELAKFAVRKFNRAFEQKVEYKSIVKGEKQAGGVNNYKLVIEVKEDDKAAKRYEFVVLEKGDKYGTKHISSIKLVP